MTETAVTSSISNGVLEVRLDRIDRRNAVNLLLVQQLGEVLAAGEASPQVGAVLLCGSGDHFCSGLDLKDPQVGEVAGPWQLLHRSIAKMSTPVVIAHHGAAINAGAALALSADVLVCAESAYLQIMESRIGMTPPVNLAWLLYRHSRALAARLAITGDRIGGDDLALMGIAHEVVPDASVVARGRELAGQIAAYPKQSATRIKQLIGGTGATFDEVLDEIVAASGE